MAGLLHSVQTLNRSLSRHWFETKMCSDNGFEGMRSVWNTQADTLKSCGDVTLQVRVDVKWAAPLYLMFFKFG